MTTEGESVPPKKYIPSQNTIHLSGKKKNLQEHKDSGIIFILFSVKNAPKITLLKVLLMNRNRNLKKGVGGLVRRQQQAVRLAESRVCTCTRVYKLGLGYCRAHSSALCVFMLQGCGGVSEHTSGPQSQHLAWFVVAAITDYCSLGGL